MNEQMHEHSLVAQVLFEKAHKYTQLGKVASLQLSAVRGNSKLSECIPIFKQPLTVPKAHNAFPRPRDWPTTVMHEHKYAPVMMKSSFDAYAPSFQQTPHCAPCILFQWFVRCQTPLGLLVHSVWAAPVAFISRYCVQRPQSDSPQQLGTQEYPTETTTRSASPLHS